MPPHSPSSSPRGRHAKNDTLVSLDNLDYLGWRREIVVLVDPYSTGCLVGKEIMNRGYLVVCVWTYQFADVMKQHVPKACGTMHYYAVVEQGTESLAETAAAVQAAANDLKITACIAGGDRGVDLADALSEFWGMPMTNGTDIPNRRDKKIQQELVRATGLRAVRQAGGAEFDGTVEAFLRTESYPLVVKPIESSGSDGVKLCTSYEQAKDHFFDIMSKPMVDGGANTGVLCQEFLRGNEYIIDHVSSNGVHKTMMVWVYDKRPVNGAAFVYFGCIPIDSESPEAAVLIPYVRGVLDAMGVKHGPSHAEVMLTADGPCLVEMNCRANGGDGIWAPLVRALTGGYTQVDAAVDAVIDPERFLSYPDKYPSPFKAAGMEIELVSYSRGTVASTPGYEMIAKLPSFVQLESQAKVGAFVDYTIDLDTCVGTVCLMHPDENVVKQDVQFIRHMELIHGLFNFEAVGENLELPSNDFILKKSLSAKKGKRPHRRVYSADDGYLVRHITEDRPQVTSSLSGRALIVEEEPEGEFVVIVDPYSTGCCIAQDFASRGYNVVALWTSDFPEDLKTHVPSVCNGKVEYHAQVHQAKTLEFTLEAIEKIAGKASNIVACLAGEETGVDLADALAEKLNLRSTGTPKNCYNKELQQETILLAGIRAIRQSSGSTFEEVQEFLQTESYPVVLKPVTTGHSDDVRLCHSMEDAQEQFELLAVSSNKILVQEYLIGREFCVDTVSKDGEHKVVMIWYYDKRPANSSASVYFGSSPVDSEKPEAQILALYVQAVLDALHLKNGPANTKVIMTADGPCLIKMNPSAHGDDGKWIPLCSAVTGGVTQVGAVVAAYLGDGSAFRKIPDVPVSPFKAAGEELVLVSYSRGTVKSTPGLDLIKDMPSFVYLETGIKEGSEVEHTVDLFTSVGSVILVNFDRRGLERDVARIRQLENDNALFEYDLLDTDTQLKSRRKSPTDDTLIITSARRDFY